MTGVFELLGNDTEKAVINAKTVMGIEAQFAKATLSEAAHNPQIDYNIKTIGQLQQLAPNFLWKSYFYDMGVSKIKSVNIQAVDVIKTMNPLLKTISLNDWKSYLQWRLISKYAPFLSKPYFDLDFHMKSVLYGFKTPRPRWLYVLNAENSLLSSAMSELYTRFTSNAPKNEILEIAHEIKKTLRNELENASWLAKSTRKKALNKLKAMDIRVGYTDNRFDYSNVPVDRGSYVLNVIRIKKAGIKNKLSQIGSTHNERGWVASALKASGCYYKTINAIYIPLAVFQPPEFDVNMPASVKYGAIGVTIAHEIMHGFDKKGAQFDGKGNLDNWWTARDLKQFQSRIDCIEKQFSSYSILDNLPVNGELVSNEVAADLAGLALAYRAYHSTKDYKKATVINGLTPDQQFFLGFAHSYVENFRPEFLYYNSMVNHHPPSLFRVNGALANIPEFQKAFHIPPESPMVNRHRCTIW